MELRTVEGRVIKDSAPDAADGKRAVLEMGTGAVHSVRHTVDRHMVKERPFEEARGKPIFGGMVKKRLVNNFQRVRWVKIPYIVLVLLISNASIRSAAQGL